MPAVILRRMRINRSPNRIEPRKLTQTTLVERHPNQRLKLNIKSYYYVSLSIMRNIIVFRKEHTLFTLKTDLKISTPITNRESFCRFHRLKRGKTRKKKSNQFD